MFSGSTTQAAPTKTPRTHKTHTPGSNHTNTNTNTRPSSTIKVTSIACYPPANDPVGPHLTVRNVGSDSVTLGNLATLRNPAYNNPAKGDDLPITLNPTLKPQRSITFVVSGQSSGGHDSAVSLPADFFSTAPADIGKEGVIITYDGVIGSSLTLTAMCPDRPATSSSAQTTKSARKKRRR